MPTGSIKLGEASIQFSTLQGHINFGCLKVNTVFHTSANVIFPRTLKLVGWGNYGNKYFWLFSPLLMKTVGNTMFFHTRCVRDGLPHIWKNSAGLPSAGARAQTRVSTCGEVKGSNVVANKHCIPKWAKNSPHFSFEDNYFWQQRHCSITFASSFSLFL